MEGSCAWCERPFGASTQPLGRRTVCPRCGVATTTPWPTAAELDAAYSGWYRPESGRFAGAGDRIFRWLRGGFARRLIAIAPPGPILDVGAGDGALVDALIATGRTAVGLDPFSTRPDFLTHDIDEVTGEWAAVVFWHSLEHIPTPVRSLREAVRMLQPGGVLIVAVPNASSLQARVFGDRWLHLDLPRHLVHIPAHALVATLRDLGLAIDRVSHYRGGNIVFGWLHGVVRSVSGLDIYDAIRKPEARSEVMSGSKRLLAIALGIVLLPIAALGAAIEVATRRGGTVYVEGRAPR